MNDEQWYKKLKVGDKVVLSIRERKRVSTIERETKTQFVLASGGRFKKGSTVLIGGDTWNRTYIREYTDEKAKEIRMQHIKAKLNQINWLKVSDEAALEIHDLWKGENND